MCCLPPTGFLFDAWGPKQFFLDSWRDWSSWIYLHSSKELCLVSRPWILWGVIRSSCRQMWGYGSQGLWSEDPYPHLSTCRTSSAEWTVCTPVGRGTCTKPWQLVGAKWEGSLPRQHFLPSALPDQGVPMTLWDGEVQKIVVLIQCVHSKEMRKRWYKMNKFIFYWITKFLQLEPLARDIQFFILLNI